MVQFRTSSGSLLTPTAPYAGLAGLPTLRAPRGIYHTPMRQFPRRRGLGAGSAGGELGTTVAGTAAKIALPAIAGSSLSIAGSAAAAIPFVGPIIALASLLFGFLGGGCGNACIESSKAEQIYEAAAIDLQNVAKLGMIGQQDYEAGVQALLQAGQQHLTQLQQQGDKKAAGGLTNLNKSIQNTLNYASQVPAAPTVPLDLTAAQAAFIQPNAIGWYPDSLQAATQAAMSYLQQIYSSPSVLSSGAGTGTVSILGTTVSSTTLLLGIALVGAAFYFSGGRG